MRLTAEVSLTGVGRPLPDAWVLPWEIWALDPELTLEPSPGRLPLCPKALGTQLSSWKEHLSATLPVCSRAVLSWAEVGAQGPPARPGSPTLGRPRGLVSSWLGWSQVGGDTS